MTYVHIALYKWKDGTSDSEIARSLEEVRSLGAKVSGIMEIITGTNTSRYSQGFTHAILVRAKTREAIDAYRIHPDHVAVAKKIESMEADGIGVDFSG